ncbi:glyoxalase superfamily protein [Pseudomonas putida]|uniref:Glyoxalase-related protein domain-containing protein n=1 Tax=Pseudomonas putida TaxID=303 RepID=A0A8I1EBH6_PSEPU|nr:glyoxalase superfamily protein [Pseudomonas putida]MBI6882317.1 hypothetical protein [Pseudomonas putida]
MQKDDVSVVKSHASILTERLKKMGIQIKRTKALELVSELHDQSDWNRLQAKLKKSQPKKPRASTAAAQCDAFFVVGPQLSGRTEALKTLFELECAEGHTSPVFISISGDAQVYKGEVDRFVSQRSVMTINYDSNGVKDFNPDKSFGHTVERPGVLFNMVPVRKGDRTGVGHAIAQLFTSLSGYLPYHLRDNVGSVLVDGIHEAPEAEQELIYAGLAEMAKSFKKTFRRAVFTSDVPAAAYVRDQLGMVVFNMIHEDLCEANEEAAGFWPVQSSKKPHKWASESLADREVIADIVWWSFRNAQIYHDEWGEPGRANGSSRVIPLPGRSFWYKDLRAALIR